MKKFFYLLLGTILGGLIGSALALLFAPASGTELRSQLSGHIANMREEISKAAQEKRQELEGQLKNLRSGN